MVAIARIDAVPKPDEATRLAVRAVYRGHAAPGQQVLAMTWILQEVLGLTGVPSAGWTPEQHAFAAGKQWGAMVIANTAGLRLWTPEPVEETK